ncbi:hypothetical protein MFLAVUS_010029 [Mucor flavus]|uniref:Uncharacterized protein n=1 Tax=Mucor flavus TaxID=439312 RepID=A0ABP9ZBJ6_9FUNG
MNFTDWENENPFKRQRTKSAWKLRWGWEADRIIYIHQKNESNNELHSTIEYPTGSKRKRESIDPFFFPELLPLRQLSDMMNSTDMVFSDPVLFDPENTEQVGVTHVQPSLIDNLLPRGETVRESPLYRAQLALRHLLAQIELSIKLQESSINNQKITINQLGEVIQNFERLLQETY